jgi:hypothetical protein
MTVERLSELTPFFLPQPAPKVRYSTAQGATLGTRAANVPQP